MNLKIIVILLLLAPNKENNELLPDNYTKASKHLDYLQKQLTKNKNLFTDYDKVIKQYLKEGIVK